MFLIDTHMHSTASFDGHDTRAAMAAASAKAGLSAICFTDHYDVINEKGEWWLDYDWSAARAEHRAIAAHPGLEVLYGIELGNAPADFAAADKALTEPGIDCVIGSIHNASMPLEGVDYYFVDYAKRPDLCAAHLNDYIQQELALVRWGNYDTLGHLPYPLRYMRDKCGQPASLAPYGGELEVILRTTAHNGKAVEINTNRARTPLDDYEPLLRQFRALGGEFVTVGADAHQKEHVGLGIEAAYDLLKACGFRYVTCFRNREPVPVKL